MLENTLRPSWQKRVLRVAASLIAFILLFMVAIRIIQLILLEDFCAPLEAHFAGASLRLRNSFVDGVGGTFQSVALVVDVVLEYGLPLLFWGAILAWPALLVWRRFRPRTTAPLAAPGI